MFNAISSAVGSTLLMLAFGQQPTTLDPDQTAKRLATAESARLSGDQATAVRLYDEILAEDPHHKDALKKSSQILRNMGKLPEAVARYERLATAHPLMREEKLELGNLFLENQQGAKALTLMSPLLADDPKDARALLIEARALSSMERRKEAREVANRVITADPDNVEALTVIASSYHWGGGAEFAREWYERALKVDPKNFNALWGLTALDLRPDPGAARRRIDGMIAQRGRDIWTNGLEKALKGDLRPIVATGYFQRESDKDLLEVYFAQLEWKLAGSRELGITATQSEGRVGASVGPSGTAKSLEAVLGLPLRSGQRLSLKGGLNDRSDSLGNTQVRPYGRASWDWGVGKKLSGNIAAAIDPYVFSLSTLQGSVDLLGVTTGIRRQFRSGFRAQAQVALAKVRVEGEQGADRWEGRFQLGREWMLGGLLPFTIDYSFNHFELNRAIKSPAYFAPLSFTGHNLEAGFKGAVPPKPTGRRLFFSLTGRYSKLSYGARDSALGGDMVVGFDLGTGLEIVGTLGRSNGSVTLSFPGATSTQFAFGLRFTPIRR